MLSLIIPTSMTLYQYFVMYMHVMMISRHRIHWMKHSVSWRSWLQLISYESIRQLGLMTYHVNSQSMVAMHCTQHYMCCSRTAGSMVSYQQHGGMLMSALYTKAVDVAHLLPHIDPSALPVLWYASLNG